VQFEAGSMLHRTFGELEIWVNSQHHQALKGVARGLVVAARARDGIVEAVELPGRGFVAGVQWHPEGTWREDPFSQKLFSALVDAAR
jgi:putative glutamine amidotransferase